VLLLVLRLRCC
jgi:hypothetical protein